MPRTTSLVEQAAQFDLRTQHEAQRRVARRSTFNSRRMWLVVAIVWTAAAGILALGVPKIG